MEVYGIENVKLVFAFIIEAGDIGGDIANMTGVKWYEKLGPLFKITNETADLFKVKWSEFPKELQDISSSEMEELRAFFNERFDIPQENLEQIIKQFFDVALVLIECTTKIVGLIKDFKRK